MMRAEISNEFVSNALAKHNYYTGISFEYIEQYEVIAMQIAHEILSDPTYATDLQKVTISNNKIVSKTVTNLD